jgi:hypothetical protein
MGFSVFHLGSSFFAATLLSARNIFVFSRPDEKIVADGSSNPNFK